MDIQYIFPSRYQDLWDLVSKVESRSGSFSGAPLNGSPMKAGLQFFAASSPPFTLSQIPYANYKVIVYLTGFNGNNASLVSDPKQGSMNNLQIHCKCTFRVVKPCIESFFYCGGKYKKRAGGNLQPLGKVRGGHQKIPPMIPCRYLAYQSLYLGPPETPCKFAAYCLF